MTKKKATSARVDVPPASKVSGGNIARSFTITEGPLASQEIHVLGDVAWCPMPLTVEVPYGRNGVEGSATINLGGLKARQVVFGLLYKAWGINDAAAGKKTKDARIAARNERVKAVRENSYVPNERVGGAGTVPALLAECVRIVAASIKRSERWQTAILADYRKGEATDAQVLSRIALAAAAKVRGSVEAVTPADIDKMSARITREAEVALAAPPTLTLDDDDVAEVLAE